MTGGSWQSAGLGRNPTGTGLNFCALLMLLLGFVGLWSHAGSLCPFSPISGGEKIYCYDLALLAVCRGLLKRQMVLSMCQKHQLGYTDWEETPRIPEVHPSWLKASPAVAIKAWEALRELFPFCGQEDYELGRSLCFSTHPLHLPQWCTQGGRQPCSTVNTAPMDLVHIPSGLYKGDAIIDTNRS